VHGLDEANYPDRAANDDLRPAAQIRTMNPGSAIDLPAPR